MATAIITQQLRVLAWPELPIDEARFFGYVVAMGIFPKEWGEEDGMIQYVDFSYNDSYERFQLPNDKKLKKALQKVLWDNLNGIAHTGDVYGKVYITRTLDGYKVELP